MSRKSRREHKTLRHGARILLWGLLAMLLLYTCGCVLALKLAGSRALEEMNQLAELYIDELDDRLLRVSRHLFTVIQEKSSPDSVFWKYEPMLETGQNTSYPTEWLRRNFFSCSWEYGTEYIFFVCTSGKKFYQLTINSEGGYIMDADLQAAVLSQMENLEDEVYSVKKKWDVIACGKERYLCKIAQNGGVSLGCVVKAESILEAFSGLKLSRDGSVALVDGSGQVTAVLRADGISDTEGGIRGGQYTIEKELARAPYGIRIQFSWASLMQTLLVSLAVMLWLAVAFLAVGAGLLGYMKQKILSPMERFMKNLEQYDEGDYTYEVTEWELLELEQADEKFRRMLHQIRRLKITLYEREMEKQRVEMDYLRLQIRPHFYLNCLNFICSMIDFGRHDTAREMSRITAAYLTYIFRSGGEAVPVSAEMDHCRNYLKILLLRYPDAFEYYFEEHEEVQDAVLLPFLIQVFVENAAKHALTLERKVLISVTVYPEDRESGTYLNLYISDTGDGFPEEVLKKLQAGESLEENGRHVGISNCLKRFRYCYGETGEIYFQNSPIGGAVVDIHIPYKKREEGADESSSGR